MPWHKSRFCAFDLETTGVDPETARIVSAAVVTFSDGEAIESRTWLVNPYVPIPDEATTLHGITDEMVRREGVSTEEAIWGILKILMPYLEPQVPALDEDDSRCYGGNAGTCC